MKRINVVSLRTVRERSTPYDGRRIEQPEDVAAILAPLADAYDRESAWVLCLDTRGRINCISLIGLGTLTEALVHPREVYKLAVHCNAHRIILAHTHPSGDPAPSPEDNAITQRIREAGDLLGIPLADHLILGDGSFYSYLRKGGLD